MLRNPGAALAAGVAANTAWDATKYKYPAVNAHNNEADAFRHGAWNRIMSRTIGPEKAKEFADAYERWRPGPEQERLMDLYNNQVARNLPSSGQPGAFGVGKTLDDALRRNAFRTSPFEPRKQ